MAEIGTAQRSQARNYNGIRKFQDYQSKSKLKVCLADIKSLLVFWRMTWRALVEFSPMDFLVSEDLKEDRLVLLTRISGRWNTSYYKPPEDLGFIIHLATRQWLITPHLHTCTFIMKESVFTQDYNPVRVDIVSHSVTQPYHRKLLFQLCKNLYWINRANVGDKQIFCAFRVLLVCLDFQ